MKKLLIRWIIVGLSLFVAAWIVPGIRVESNGVGVYAATAAILGFVNAIVRPLLVLLTCPAIILTLGLFVLVVNAFSLMIASWIAINWFHVGFHVDGFGAAFWGGLVISLVSFTVNLLTGTGNTSLRVRTHRGDRRPPPDPGPGNGPVIDV